MAKINKLSAFIIFVLTILLFPLSGCIDREIYFSVDEIQGDINTGKQIPIDNHLTSHVGVIKINVQNAKGNVEANSSNTDIAQVEVYHYQLRHPELTLRLIRPGDVIITVKDEDGNTAQLYITATPIYE